MKWKQRVGVVVLLALAKAAAGQGVIAPVYPGAVADNHAGDVTVRVYLTHAPLDQVEAWYAGKVGGLSHDAGVTLRSANSMEQEAGQPIGTVDPAVVVTQLGRVTMNQSTVVRSLKDMTRTKDIGVLCEGMHHKPADGGSAPAAGAAPAGDGSQAEMMKQLAAMQAQLQRANQQLTGSMSPADRKIAAMSDLFKGLRVEALGGQHGHTKQQLLHVYAKYKHLETDWYPTVKTSSGLQSYDRWLLAKDEAKLKAGARAGTVPAETGAADMQALSARIQAAAAAGRMDEVQALSEQMQRGMAGQEVKNQAAAETATKDHWAFWMAYLKNLDAHAYRTRIWINTAPKTWGY